MLPWHCKIKRVQSKEEWWGCWCVTKKSPERLNFFVQFGVKSCYKIPCYPLLCSIINTTNLFDSHPLLCKLLLLMYFFFMKSNRNFKAFLSLCIRIWPKRRHGTLEAVLINIKDHGEIFLLRYYPISAICFQSKLKAKYIHMTIKGWSDSCIFFNNKLPMDFWRPQFISHYNLTISTTIHALQYLT